MEDENKESETVSTTPESKGTNKMLLIGLGILVAAMLLGGVYLLASARKGTETAPDLTETYNTESNNGMVEDTGEAMMNGETDMMEEEDSLEDEMMESSGEAMMEEETGMMESDDLTGTSVEE